MYLIHVTNEKSLKSILKDGYIKSLSLIKKIREIIMDGDLDYILKIILFSFHVVKNYLIINYSVK